MNGRMMQPIQPRWPPFARIRWAEGGASASNTQRRPEAKGRILLRTGLLLSGEIGARAYPFRRMFVPLKDYLHPGPMRHQ
jgi:hypothetical protein